MQSTDYQALFASLEKRQTLFAQCRMQNVLLSLEKRHLVQVIDYQTLFALL